MSSFGKIFKITTFGESHGIGVGCIVENVPSMLKLSNEDIQYQLNRRKPNQNSLLSTRAEPDIVEIYSGVQGGVTLGTPICLIVKNVDIKPSDYKKFSNIPRPGHADLTYLSKYGVKSSSGGGRASARETVARVAGGSIAEKYLKLNFSTEIVSFVKSIGVIEIPKEDLKNIILNKKINKQEVDLLGTYCLFKKDEGDFNGIILLNKFLNRAFNFTDPIYNDDNLDQIKETNNDKIIEIETNKENLILSEDEKILTISNKLNEKEYKYTFIESINIRCPHPETAVKMIIEIMKIKSECDSIGGTVSCVIRNCPRSLGEPCFDKFEAELAKAMLSIPATKGFEIGSGFEGTKMK
jgi:chorismate synthase